MKTCEEWKVTWNELYFMQVMEQREENHTSSLMATFQYEHQSTSSVIIAQLFIDLILGKSQATVLVPELWRRIFRFLWRRRIYVRDKNVHWVKSRSNCCFKEVMKWIFYKSLLFALKTRGVIFGLRDKSDIHPRAIKICPPQTTHKAILQSRKTWTLVKKMKNVDSEEEKQMQELMVFSWA